MGMSRKHKKIFEELHAQAKPGDILFMTSVGTPLDFTVLRRIKRLAAGFHPCDFSSWHIALYVGPTESGNAEIVEAVRSGVRVSHLTSTYYTRGRSLELGRFTHASLDDEVRGEIVAVAK